MHVCRRWRKLVFGSPHHLNVHLFCSIKTPVVEKLAIWPALPIVVYQHGFSKRRLGNLIAAIKPNDRVCKISLHSFFDVWQLERIVSEMQVPFPALKDLELVMGKPSEMVIPDSFLGGSSPRLRRLHLGGVLFPGLPKLLLSATDLVSLQLRQLPYSFYISPDEMVTYLSALGRLELFTLEFGSSQSRQDRESRCLTPPIRTLLPALTSLRFKSILEYAEDLMTRIDAPRLHRLHITFFHEAVPSIPHLSQFINRIPKLQTLDDARVTFSNDKVRITLSRQTTGSGRLVLEMPWDDSVGQLSTFARLCRSFSSTLAMVEHLYMGDEGWGPSYTTEGLRHTQWFNLLHLFTGAKNLRLSDDVAPRISPALGHLTAERAIEVLPALKILFYNEHHLRRCVRDDIEMFVGGRGHHGYPIAVRSWSI